MENNTWSDDQPIVSIQNVHKSFGALEVLKGVSLDVMKGEVVCIIGPSGSGQIHPDPLHQRPQRHPGRLHQGGRVWRFMIHTSPRPAGAAQEEWAWCSSSTTCFPHKTALENVMMAPLLGLEAVPRMKLKFTGPGSLIEEGAPAGQGGRLSRRIVGRSAAARRHCPLTGHEPGRHAVR